MTLEDAMRQGAEMLREMGFNIVVVTEEALIPVDEDGNGFWDPSQDMGAGQEPGELVVQLWTKGNTKRLITIREGGFLKEALLRETLPTGTLFFKVFAEAMEERNLLN